MPCEVVRDSRGNVIAPYDLPAPDTRWTPRRKELVVLAVRGNLVPLADVLERYRMRPEEFAEWGRGIAGGRKGLRTTVHQPSASSSDAVAERAGDPTAALLDVLRRNRGRVVSNRALFDHLYAGRPDPPLPKIVDVFMTQLRKRPLAGARDIETVWGRGYMMRDAPATRGVPAHASACAAACSS